MVRSKQTSAHVMTTIEVDYENITTRMKLKKLSRKMKDFH